MTLWLHWALTMKRLKLENSLGSHLARQASKCGLVVATGQNYLAWKHKESNKMMRLMCLTSSWIPCRMLSIPSEGSERNFICFFTHYRCYRKDGYAANMVTGFKIGWLEEDVSRMVPWVTRIFQRTVFKVLSHCWENCRLHIYSYNGRRVAVGICRCNFR